MAVIRCVLLAFIVVCTFFGAAIARESEAEHWYGINLAGAEFAPQVLPGIHGKDYLYPTANVIHSYTEAGFNVIRVPFLWERMQPRMGGLLNPLELRQLDAVVMEAKRQHLTVIIDLHNYGMYRGQMVGSSVVPVDAFAHFWRLLARHYREQPHIVFGLMNEPHQHTADQWLVAARAALKAIRSEGASQPVLLPGTLFTGAHSWNQKAGGHSNAESLASLRDPAIFIEIHQYLDTNSSGTHTACVMPDEIERILQPVTEWLAKTHHRAVLAEFGAAASTECLKTLDALLKHVSSHRAQWKGWAYWGASEWFGEYPFNVYPPDEKLHPQLTELKKYIQ